MQQALQDGGNKPRVLLAAREIACAPFRESLRDDVEFVEAGTLSEAVSRLEAPEAIDLICCTVYFDESRMFDLLRWARVQRADIPFICARALPKDIARISIEAVRIAADNLGATAFVDVPALVAEHGEAQASEKLRGLLLAQLGA